MNTQEKKQNRLRRRARVRAKIKGSADRPRLSVFRSHKHLAAQLIDDAAARTIAAASDRDITGKRRGGRMAAAELLGVAIAKKAAASKITKAVFDRGGYQYHGIVRAIADGARKGGLAM